MHTQINFKKTIISLFFLSLTHCFGTPNPEPANNPDGGTSDPDAKSNARKGDAEPESTCKQTACDIEFKFCKNPTCRTPCEKCLEACEGLALEEKAQCSETCKNNTCSKPDSSTCSNPCTTIRDACRKTKKNSVCVEHALDPIPKGTPPCTKEFFTAFCSVSDETKNALRDANKACLTCEIELNACIEKTCQSELNAILQAGIDLKCDTLECIEKQKPELFEALNKCIKTSIDTKGECHSVAHSCWEDPSTRSCSK